MSKNNLKLGKETIVTLQYPEFITYFIEILQDYNHTAKCPQSAIM